VAELVADLLPDATPEIVDAVVERAEGNPFYAGEIVRSLIDRLGAVPDPSAVPAAIASLPDTVQATVLARLDALDPASRRVVQLGSGTTARGARVPPGGSAPRSVGACGGGGGGGRAGGGGLGEGAGRGWRAGPRRGAAAQGAGAGEGRPRPSRRAHGRTPVKE